MDIENANRRLLDSEDELSYSQRIAISDLINKLEQDNKELRDILQSVVNGLPDDLSAIETVDIKFNVNQEYCKWEYQNNDEVYAACDNSKYHDAAEAKEFKYCPYCELKIKIKGEYRNETNERHTKI